VRATGDNPAVDIGGAARVLAALRSTRADHVVEDGLPYGGAVEGVSVDALVRASKFATDPADREHVTPWIRRDRGRFTALQIPAPRSVRNPDVRVTVDTNDDLRFMQDLAARLDNWSAEPELRTIVKAALTLTAGARCA
jgi:spore coat polysaccharide biosynthesis protein SpsF (cytidylyltransferase family)